METLNERRVLGYGGAPTRTTTLPEGAHERKQFPVASGFLDYFPDAVVAVAELSKRANDQHNPGEPLHWARSKSADEVDTLIRHFLQRGQRDADGVRHSVKMAWRAMALLQKEIEAEQDAAKPSPEEMVAAKLRDLQEQMLLHSINPPILVQGDYVPAEPGKKCHVVTLDGFNYLTSDSEMAYFAAVERGLRQKMRGRPPGGWMKPESFNVDNAFVAAFKPRKRRGR